MRAGDAFGLLAVGPALLLLIAAPLSAQNDRARELRGDVADAVAELKRGDGPEIQVHGSANLIQTLLQHDLIDEFNIWTFPLVLGTGKRLFGAGTMPTGMRVADTMVATTGVVLVTYERAAGINYGSFALEQPSAEEVERRTQLS